jgi:hypothetical protein
MQALICTAGEGTKQTERDRVGARFHVGDTGVSFSIALPQRKLEGVSVLV